ncbi:UxaA family hydrolase [Candidatus Borrarchaeum sp.]|uniref:UxaA family hydrolase n=1 Tax=Candidatus Borrarchaeum sp. TaxID=2846742 RepID=UPI00257C04E5|nr:UxaA family hydrolase [Candidatus Borrarchaeum sp.]
MEFMGYKRPDGSVGVRNYVGIIAAVVCANEVVNAIVDQVGEPTKALTHNQGCCQLKPDLEQIERTLIGIGKNPNIAAVLVVSLGCESVKADRIVEEIKKTGKPVEKIGIYDLKGSTNAIEQGVKIAKKLVDYANESERTPASIKDLTIGIKCGASDTTSGLASNPAVGVATDMMIDAGSSVIFGEVTEFIGAEHILTKRAVNEDVANKIYGYVNAMEKRAEAVGVDLRGSQPTAGNIRGGLTTIEEKSLGAIIKGGTRTIQEVVDYSARPSKKGLIVMNTPGFEITVLTGLAAAGAQILLFTTGLGAPQGHPMTPVVKITGNSQTMERMGDHIDVDVSGILSGTLTMDAAGKKIVDEIVEVANGKQTRAEILGYTKSMDVYVLGPVV